MIATVPHPAFDRTASSPSSPVVISVPHAGRDYPEAMAERLQVPLDRLIGLEDRHVDRLVVGAAQAGAATLIARTPRAWIDLNRGENEIDPAMLSPPPAHGTTLMSAKVRGGLGLVPRRLAGVGEIWRERLTPDELASRIATLHRPYHEALDAMLRAARARFGVAILVDLHSMPPISDPAWARPPQIVFGDRFGRSAGARFTSRLSGEAEAAGFVTADNSPYAGGYVLERHGAPARDIHAVQVEIDRTLYLKPDLRGIDPAGVARMDAFVRTIVQALVDEALTGPATLAAE